LARHLSAYRLTTAAIFCCLVANQSLARSIMLMHKFSVALMLLSALLVPPHSNAEAMFSVNFLGVADFSPTGMNNAGQITGFAGAGDGTIHAMLYSNGVLSDLGNFGGKDSYATAINDAGALTGSILLGSDEQHAFLYQDGITLDLGAGTAGYGINAHGDVVGTRQSADGATAFVYSAGKLTELGNLGTGKDGIAVGINDDGTVAGDSSTGPGASRHPFLYRDGIMRDLGALGDHAVNGVAAINNAGQIAGYSGADDTITHAFLYEGGVMRDLGGFGEGTLEIHDLNEHGTLVGTASTEEEGLIPFMSLGNVLVDLNMLIDPALGWHIFSARANNDLGQIVGYGCQGDACGLVRLDLAGAVPEPGASFLLLAGLLVVAGLGWRIVAKTIMLSRKFLAALACIPALLVPLSSQANPLYDISVLPGGFIGNDINNAGQMAGQFWTPTGFTSALYSDGIVTSLAIPGDTLSVALAINSAGVVTGYFNNMSSEVHAFTYSHGNVVDIGTDKFGLAINDRGDVAGQIIRPGQTGFLYGGGTVTALGNLETGGRGSALDINNAGQIVGESTLMPAVYAPTHPFLYAQGTLLDLGTLFDGARNGAQAINDAGQIAGYGEAPDGTMHAFLYEHGVMRDAGTFGTTLIDVTAINESGMFVGDSARDGASHRFGFVYLDGAMIELSTLVDPVQGWRIDQALGINDLGQITVVGCRDDSGYCNGLRLDPTHAIPEPAGVLLLLPGLLALALAVPRSFEHIVRGGS
jgi:probable HAF family extracellular repeat protein